MSHTTAIVNMSPEDARRYLENNTFPGQRSLSQTHVRFLKETILAQEFDGGAPIRFAISPGRGWVIVDGQHRLAAIAAQITVVEVLLVYTECKSDEDLAKLYSRIDRGRHRNMVDAMRGLGLIAKDNSMTQTDFKSFSAASVLLRTGLTSKHIAGNSYDAKSAEARHAEMCKWSQPAQEYFNAIRNSTERGLFDRQQVAAIGIVTFADATHMAQTFWREAAKDDGLRANDPRKKMLEVLRRTPVRASEAGYLGNVVAACWNAYVEGRDLSKVIVRDPRADITLLETRYARR